MVRDESEARAVGDGLKRALGLGSYQTAWMMLHRFRGAMVRPGRERLAGRVEVDETYVGGEEEGVAGRQTDQKSIVAIAVEVKEPKGLGAPAFSRVPDVSAASLVSFVREMVEPGTAVMTDGWAAYGELPEHGFAHEKTILSTSGDPAHVSMPAVHRVASLLKRWLLGTHQGSASPQHLDAYLNEWTFRFNRRTSTRRGLLFSPPPPAGRPLPARDLQADHPPRPPICLTAANWIPPTEHY